MRALLAVAFGKGFGGIRFPLLQAAVAQEIFEIEQKLLQAGAGNVDQPELGLRGGGEGAAPSAIFCRPLRAAWIIWSLVRERGSKKRSQNQ